MLGQWVSELSSKTYKSTIKVGVHHPSVQKLSAGQMQLFDVVLTSYEMVGRESPHPRKAAGTGQKATRHGSGDSERGPLFRTCFHRIILDEAHLIKNPSAERTRAVWELQGGFRWCLSGTPIQNNVGDLYPLLRFLGLPEFPTKEAFDKSITSLLPTRRSAEAMMRLHSILQRFCLRRRKDEQSPLGQPLLNLPQRTIVVDQEAEFTEDERRFYDAIRRNTRRMFAGLMKRGTVMRNFSNVLTRILRERQAADDFRIIKSNFTKKELGDAEAISSFEALLARIFGDPTDQDREKELERARKLFSKSVFESLVLEGRRANADGEQRNRFTDPCPLCRDLLDSPMVTKCGHVFCKDCINGYMADDGNKEAGCPADECGTALKSNEMVSVEAFYVPVKSGEIGASQVDEAEQRQDEEDEAAIRKVLSGGPDCGAKILRLLELLEKQQAEKPGSKAIVFSSFTSMLGLCARALKEKGIGFAQYDGSMPPAQRDAAVRSLNKDPRTLVLLVSLKAGGVGLNLTAASRAYLLDIWYNPQVDSQAIDRIHRIGQTENVVVTRITIKDTIEESIARLQERKARLARGALGDDRGGAGEANRLTIRDLAELFGAAGGLSV